MGVHFYTLLYTIKIILFQTDIYGMLREFFFISTMSKASRLGIKPGTSDLTCQHSTNWAVLDDSDQHNSLIKLF